MTAATDDKGKSAAYSRSQLAMLRASSPVPCNGCTACCRGRQVVVLMPPDDVAYYGDKCSHCSCTPDVDRRLQGIVQGRGRV